MKSSPLYLAVATLGFLSMGFPGCEESQYIQNWVNKASKLRETMEDQIPSKPYQTAQHETFKNYFAELNQLALALQKDSRFRDRFSAAASKSDMGAICRKVFTPRSRWDQLMRNCTKNRFFLCAEEVRAYPDLVGGLRGALKPSLQSRFDEAQDCKNAL